MEDGEYANAISIAELVSAIGGRAAANFVSILNSQHSFSRVERLALGRLTWHDLN